MKSRQTNFWNGRVTGQRLGDNRGTSLNVRLCQRNNSCSSRTGFTIVELLGACLLLGMILSISVPMFLVVTRERRAAEQRQFALQHVTNLLEGATSRVWSDLEPGTLPIPEAGIDLQAVLPGLERSLVVQQTDDTLPSRQITASVRWQDRSGALVAPIKLSAWIYPTQEDR